jgi:hypothetical protein
MNTKKKRMTKAKVKTLTARPVSGKQAGAVKGGDTNSGGSDTYKKVPIGLRKSG